MRIGIIGVGRIGSTIARRLAASGHEVRVANSKGPESVRSFADQIGAAPVDIRGAVDEADVVVLSIPFMSVADLPDDLFDSLPVDVPIVDTGNYYPGIRDRQLPELDAGKPESVWVAEQVRRPVVKAFNNILAEALADSALPAGSPGRLAVAVAGDSAEAKRIVMGLVDEVGFDPVDAGTLEESWRVQPATPGYCCDYDAETLQRGIASAVKGAAPKRRDPYMAWLKSLGRWPSHAELRAANRMNNGVD